MCGTFGGDFSLGLWLWSQNVMYTNTTYNHVYYEVSSSNVHSISPQCVFHQTKMFANVHYIPICQI